MKLNWNFQCVCGGGGGGGKKILPWGGSIDKYVLELQNITGTGI